ncbi:hypothetical protein Q31b_33200 [Novipirellula aureliae]|uniref:Uncharacterized protein n=1 Tax=Novipirellula aureliae TaxID=2527966 RepID=A0A5C6DUR7_9BACT|nr:hypothetical protein [Novipirellula aureliae]TWU40004.1 hypothetical protein Q31b_33200 [Novipirellula aureliae]
MRKLATICTVHEIRPINGADMIELAVVDGWKCVTKKGEFADGDAVIYCEIDSFLPVRVPYSMDAILALAEGKSALNPKTEREGLVWVRSSGDDRISFKTISNKFLAKYGE